jgi:ubiquinone/menaquinone biosynthesis C-methylase UbiE
MPKKLIAKNHREAYDLWATYFEDPALMANRDAETTRRKIEKLVRQLPLEPESRVLDVGPGDGALFQTIAARVRRCCGVDPSVKAVAKLRSLFRDLPNVEFAVGSADALPCRGAEFDVVVINSVLHILPSAAVVERSLSEIARVCAPGGVVFVGEVPFRSELQRGILAHMARKFREYGLRALMRLVYHVYLRPLFRGEPVVIYPARNLHFPEVEFEAMCRGLGVSVECRRHQELRRPSLTRNDYLLRLPPTQPLQGAALERSGRAPAPRA